MKKEGLFKKLTAVCLTVIMLFSIAGVAFAEKIATNDYYYSKTPVVYISGDSNPLSYDNGTKSFEIGDMLSIFGNSEDGNVFEAIMNILYPFILKGIVNDDWDDYYDAVYKEISEVFAPILLDNNGNVQGDCGISEKQKQDMKTDLTQNKNWYGGKYNERSYCFYYDWRLDPIELADQLNDYIEGVKKATGASKVGISCRCLGCNVVLSYINKYSTDSLKGVGIDVSTSMGADFLSGILSGDFHADGNGLSRMCYDLGNRLNESEYPDVFKFAAATVDILANTGALDGVTELAREKIYEKIEYGIISALARSTFLTFPCYWALVTVEDFDTALEYVFGPEGSELRQQYSGLIEKITNYNETIKKNVYPIMKTLETDGVNIAVISKYGEQTIPAFKGADILADEYVAVSRSSFGATTSNVYTTLSDEYIAQRVAEGKGKYISPDKKIDASTCLFPDYTWFYKNVSHGYYTTSEVHILMQVIDSDEQLTVDDFDVTQFVVFDYDTRIASPMTEENCNTEPREADEETDHPKTKKQKLMSFLKALFGWVGTFFELIVTRFK